MRRDYHSSPQTFDLTNKVVCCVFLFAFVCTENGGCGSLGSWEKQCRVWCWWDEDRVGWFPSCFWSFWSNCSPCCQWSRKFLLQKLLKIFGLIKKAYIWCSWCICLVIVDLIGVFYDLGFTCGDHGMVVRHESLIFVHKFRFFLAH